MPLSDLWLPREPIPGLCCGETVPALEPAVGPKPTSPPQHPQQTYIHPQDLLLPTTIRVLHVINGEYYAGAERVQDLLGQYLPSFGVQVAFAVLKPGLFVRQRRCGQVPLWPMPMRHRLDLRPAWALARLIRQETYRILHAHTPRALLVGSVAAWLAGVPLVYHVHSPAWADSTRGFFNWANAAIEHLLLRQASAVVCVSQALAHQMQRRGVPKAKIRPVPNGVPSSRSQWKPTGWFLSLLAENAGIPAEGLNGLSSFAGQWAERGRDFVNVYKSTTPPLLPNRTPLACTVGTVALFRPRKGLEVLLEAVARLARQGVPVRLRAVGPFETPVYQQAVLQKIAHLGLADRVHCTGPVENVEAELLNMDIFILPSLFGEGLPMVLLEAMAVGMPIIASQLPGIDEAICPGQEGLLVPPGNPEALAQAIFQLMTHPDQALRLAQQARRRHYESYSAQAMAAALARVYRQVVWA